MKRLSIMAAVLVTVAAIAGCQTDPGFLNDNFTVSSEDVQFDGNTLSFGPERRSVTIDVTTEASAGKWSAICPTEDVWCSFSPPRGGSLVVTVALNDTDMPRSSWIEIALGDNVRRIAVEQDYMRVLTFPGGSGMNEGANAHAVSIPVQTNIAAKNLSVRISEPAECDWITGLAVSATAVTFNLLRNPSAESARPATITVEGDGSNASVTVTQNALSGYPYVIDLAEATFTESYIYEIWDEVHDMKIGELCREYLHKTPEGGVPEVRKQAVTAYPVKDGKVDLASGLVVDDGCFIAWNPGVTASTQPYEILASYTAGETVDAVPTVIYLDEGASRMTTQDIEALPEDRIHAVLRPYLLTDGRSGEANNHDETQETEQYKVVKIGTQYWMAENLRTRRYRDGSNIPTDITNATWAQGMNPGCVVSNLTSARYLDANDPAAQDARQAYGCLYNFHAIIGRSFADGAGDQSAAVEDKISPAGWSVPRREELEQMRNYVTQSTLPTGTFPELDYDGAGELGNATGFGMRGNTSRGQSGGWNNNQTNVATMGYRYDGTPGNEYAKHTYYCLRMQPGSEFAVNAGNMYVSRVANFVRCLRD